LSRTAPEPPAYAAGWPARAIERDQVGADWLGPELAEQRHNLAAVIRTVVQDVVEHRSDRPFEGCTARVLILDYAPQLGGRERIDVRVEIAFVLRPACAQGFQIRKIRGGRKSGWDSLAPAFEPEPFGAVDVRECVAHRAKTGAEIARELLRRQGCTGIERAAVRPGVEIVQLAKIINRHANSFSKLEIRLLNFGIAS
jgi:hypothetical protein